VKPDVEVEAVSDGSDQLQGVRSPIGEIREEDIPGAIRNPSTGDVPAQDGGALQKINKTSSIRPDLTAIDPESVDIGEWEKRDNQFRRAFELLKTFGVFKPDQVKSS
jgi:hypothetical protein